jgi:DNA-binding CsgD family transcriptional regulator/tetratricopeptide (TPR) repeat protein
MHSQLSTISRVEVGSHRAAVAELARRCGAGDDICAALIGVGGSGKSHALASIRAECNGVGRSLTGFEPTLDTAADRLIVVDDAHRLSDDDLRRLANLMRNGGASVIVALRPALDRPGLGDLIAAVSDRGSLVPLGPLDDADLGAAMAVVLNAAPEGELVNRLAEASAGNALVAFRLLSGWQQLGLLTRGRLNNGEAPLDPRTLVDALTGRIAQLDQTARELLGSLALLPVDAAFVHLTRRHPREFAALVNAGLVVADRVGTAIAACLVHLIEPVVASAAHAAAADALEQLDSPAPEVAEHLWSVRADSALALATYIRAGNALIDADPNGALSWFRRAAAIDRTTSAALGGVARAATALGRADEALDAATALEAIDPNSGLAAAIAGAAFASRGLWSDASTVLATASESSDPLAGFWRVQGELCALIAGKAVATPVVVPARDLPAALTRLVADALKLSVSSSPVDIANARERLGDAATLADLVRLPPVTAVAPTEVGAAVAIALGDLPLAERLAALIPHHGLRGHVARRMTTWVALRQGDADAVVPTHADDVLGLAVLAAQSRRSGDVAAGAAVARSLPTALAGARIHALNVDAAGELLVLARRFGPKVVADDLEARMASALRAIGGSVLWSVRFEWSILESAVHTRRADLASASAARLRSVGVLAPHLEPLAEAATVWADLIAGSVDHGRVEAAVAALSDLRLGWEAANLAGQAAIRVDDADAAKALLGRARVLRAGSTPASPNRAESDRPITPAGLSGREAEVGRLVLDGLTHKDIGATLFISPKTVEHHVAHIRQKLGASSRPEMLSALRLDLASTRDVTK